MTLSEREQERYKRQLMLQGFSPEHQEALKGSTALIAGVGGLGGAAATYLAVAGIGRLVLAHYGNLTLSNMNRQTLMKHEGIGTPRVVMAKETIIAMNPDVEVDILNVRTLKENATELLEGAAVALSARPNFSERRELNSACVEKSIPMVEAAMNGMGGYLFNVVPGQTSCLECVFPGDDPQWEELGFPVLGAVSGLLGCAMAIEAIKLLTGYGRPLLDRMLVFDTLDMDFRKLPVQRDKGCKVCGGLHR